MVKFGITKNKKNKVFQSFNSNRGDTIGAVSLTKDEMLAAMVVFFGIQTNIFYKQLFNFPNHFGFFDCLTLL